MFGFSWTKVYKFFHQDTVSEQLLEDFELEATPGDGPDDYSVQTNTSHSCTPNENVVFGEPSIVPESCTQIIHTNSIPGSVEEAESQRTCTISSLSDLFQQFQEEINMKVEDITSNLQPTSGSVRDSITTEATNVPLSVAVEEDLLFFGDIDEFKISEVQGEESKFPGDIGGENCPSSSPKGVEELNGSSNKDDQSHSSEEEVLKENQSTDFENSTANSRVSSSPIGINRVHKVAGEEVGWQTESLPTMWSQINSFDEHHIHCLSHSLDSKSKSLNWTMQSKDNSSSIRSDGDKEHQLEPQLPDANDALETGEVKNVPANPTVGKKFLIHILYNTF